MLIRKAVRYRLEPTAEQEHLYPVRSAAPASPGIGRSLSRNPISITAAVSLSYVDMAKRLNTWRNGESFGFLSESPVHPQQQTLD